MYNPNALLKQDSTWSAKQVESMQQIQIKAAIRFNVSTFHVKAPIKLLLCTGVYTQPQSLVVKKIAHESDRGLPQIFDNDF